MENEGLSYRCQKNKNGMFNRASVAQ
ncbi:unnamed protein product, partial [Rotaria socialis]